MADTTRAQQVDEELKLPHRSTEELKLLAERNEVATDKRWDELMALTVGLAEEVRKLAAHMKVPLLSNPGNFISQSSRNLENDNPETVSTRKEGNTRLRKLDLPTSGRNGEWTDEFTEAVEVGYHMFDEIPKSVPTVLQPSSLINIASRECSSLPLSGEAIIAPSFKAGTQLIEKVVQIFSSKLEVGEVAYQVLDKLTEPIQTEVSLLHLTARDFSSHSLLHDDGNDYIASKISGLKTGRQMFDEMPGPISIKYNSENDCHGDLVLSRIGLLKIPGYGEVAPELHLLKIECLQNTRHMFDKMSTLPSAEQNEGVVGMFLFDPGGSSLLYNRRHSFELPDGKQHPDTISGTKAGSVLAFDHVVPISRVKADEHLKIGSDFCICRSFQSLLNREEGLCKDSNTTDNGFSITPLLTWYNLDIMKSILIIHDICIQRYQMMYASDDKIQACTSIFYYGCDLFEPTGDMQDFDSITSFDCVLHVLDPSSDVIGSGSVNSSNFKEVGAAVSIVIRDGDLLIDDVMFLIGLGRSSSILRAWDWIDPFCPNWGDIFKLAVRAFFCVFEPLVSIGVIDVDLQTYVWETGQYMIPYILEDNDVLKRKGIGVRLALKQDEELNGILT